MASFSHYLPYLTVALAGLAAACWQQVRTLASQLAGTLVVRAQLDEGLTSYIQAWLAAECRRSPLSSRVLASWADYVRPWGRVSNIAYDRLGYGRTVFWKGWRPLVVTEYGEGCTVAFVRGLFDLDRLVVAAAHAAAARNDRQYAAWERRRAGIRVPDRFRVENVIGSLGEAPPAFGAPGGMPLGMSGGQSPAIPPATGHHRGGRPAHGTPLIGLTWDDVGGIVAGVGEPYEHLAIDAEAQAAIDSARRWYASRDWYAERGIAWTLGWLLHGGPGCGKTSLLRAVALDLDIPIYLFDLATMRNADFARAWEDAQSHAPAMVVFEDVDGVFEGRKNVAATQGGLTFDCLLNHMDGAKPAHGVFTVVTTNRVAALDPALGVPDGADGRSTRPGRINRAVHLGPPDRAGREKIARRILADAPHLVTAAVLAGDGESAAQFQERCVRLALEVFWSEDAGAEAAA